MRNNQWMVLPLLFVLHGVQAESKNNSFPRGKVSNIPMHEASIEDIDSKNFPNIVQSFDYPNVKIETIVEAISKLTGINFIIDPAVKGTVSITSPSPITVAEAFQAFLSALAINGYAIVRSGAFWKVVSAEKASRDNIQIYKGDYFPESDQYITKIFKIKYTSVKNLETHLKQFLTDKKHKVIFDTVANAIIISDYGSAIEKISKIIKELDVPDSNNIVEVIPIKYAPALDLSLKLQVLIEQRSSAPRSSKPGSNLISMQKTHTGVSAIIPDERTNSIVVAGSKDGIQKTKDLIKKLDFYINPQVAGGIFVYYVKHGKAEEIEKTLNNILNPASPKGSSKRDTRALRQIRFQNYFGSQGGLSNIAVSHDKNTNSLIITASRHDYDVLKEILDKIDIPKNQVFIKTIIMNLNVEDNLNWNVSTYKFLDSPEGGGLPIPRIGFSSNTIEDILSAPGDESVLSFGLGKMVNLTLPPSIAKNMGLGAVLGNTEGEGEGESTPPPLLPSFKVPNIISLVNLIKKQTGANILSTPQIIAMDNEESSISVGLNTPVGKKVQQTGGNLGALESVERQDVETNLKITPYINPDGQSVRLIIEQKIDSITPTQALPDTLRQESIAITKRKIKTNVILNDGETAVIGGLMTNEETEVIQKVPILGDIPIIGWLFRAKDKKKQKTNLVIFITPKIIKTAQDYKNILKDKLDERMDFIKKHMSIDPKSNSEFHETISSSPSAKKPQVARSNNNDNMIPQKITDDRAIEEPSQADLEMFVEEDLGEEDVEDFNDITEEDNSDEIIKIEDIEENNSDEVIRVEDIEEDNNDIFDDENF